MKEFKDKVAVITGAASGIGFGIAERCAQEGMKVVLAGINQDNLSRAEEALRPTGATTLCVETDVSKLADIEALAEKTLDAFGAVHILVNNAGVAAGGPVWESTLADWQWVLAVNLWGVIYGLKTFVPIMLAQDTECHVVNVSSVAGLLPYHPSAPYQVTKHAVVALSENLHYSLAMRNTKVKVSVLCPGWVKTRIMDSGRNRPPELQNEPGSEPPSPERAAILASFYQAVQAGLSPQVVADRVFQAIRSEQFVVLTDSDYNSEIQQRMEGMRQQLLDH
jgi:NAD(P)-dependent dehydrogenase (short-subunit alcohol dehydrogenase family)